MDPQKIRRYLQVAGVVLGVASAVVAKLLEVDLTNISAIVGAVAMTIGLAIGKSLEAPGGVPKWKIPEHLHKYIPK
jgi:hypothetical protein